MLNQLISLGLIAQLALGVGETFAVARPGAGEGGRAEAPSAGAPKTTDRMFAEVTRQAPGFGGMYVDED